MHENSTWTGEKKIPEWLCKNFTHTAAQVVVRQRERILKMCGKFELSGVVVVSSYSFDFNGAFWVCNFYTRLTTFELDFLCFFYRTLGIRWMWLEIGKWGVDGGCCLNPSKRQRVCIDLGSMDFISSQNGGKISIALQTNLVQPPSDLFARHTAQREKKPFSYKSKISFDF